MTPAAKRRRAPRAARCLGRPAGLTLGAATAVAAAGCDRMSLLATRGVTGAHETALGWFLLITASVVVVVITILVLAAWARARSRPAGGAVMAGGHRGFSWIVWGGIVVPSIILIVAFAFTLVTLKAVAEPAGAPVATIRVVGHQWWWEVHYESAAPDQAVTAANEIHIPVGEPVQFELESADVIHSFWVPQLAGKTDMIPGQTNEMWIEAKQPGVYTGTCGEFCGAQHAHMLLRIVAESPDQYTAWLAGQRRAAAPPPDSAAAGLHVFLTTGCANCHTIRGTAAGGNVGPDLTHIASRQTIAAGTLPNTKGNLIGWITDAPAIKPGADMPRMAVPARDLPTLVAYLETLR